MSKFSITQATVHGTSYSGIRGYVINRAIEIDSEATDGTVHETLHVDVQHRPTAEITTLAARTWVNSVLTSSSDLPLLELNGTTGVVFFGAKADTDAPGYLGAGNHLSVTALRGLLHASSFDWSLGGNLELGVRGLFRSNAGGTDSLTTSAAASIPTLPTPAEKLTLTSLTLAGDDVTSVRSYNLAIEAPFEHAFDTGQVHPVDIFGPGTAGPLAFRLTVDAEDIDLGDGSGGITAVFTQRAAGGGLGANTLTLTLNGGWSVEESLGGDNGSPMSRSLVARPKYDGVTLPFTWAVA